MNYYERLLAKPKHYISYRAFLVDAAKYFRWAEEHPLLEDNVFQYKGDTIHTDKKKMRAFTKKGLVTFLGITEARLNSYKRRNADWQEAVQRVEDIIYTQKFEGAAAGLLNPGLISRDLGLAEKQQIENTGPGGAALPVFNILPVASGTFIPAEEGKEA